MVVDVKDVRLGLISKFLTLVIIIRIGILTIWKNGAHLAPVPVFGSARANAQMPTEGACNPVDPDCRATFTPLSELPYCAEYGPDPADGPNNTLEAANITRPVRVAHCTFWDAVTMTRGRSPVPGTFFIPTRVTTFYEKKGCDPSKSNKYSCDPKPFRRDLNNPKNDKPHFFLADVERFTLLVNQAYQAFDDKGNRIAGRAADFKGVVDPISKRSRQYLDHKVYKGTVTHTTITGEQDTYEIGASTDNSPFKSIRKVDQGDIVSIEDLMLMADPRGKSLLDAPREDGSTMRWEGAVMSVDIEYTNQALWDPFAQTEPHYVMTVSYLPMKEYKIQYGEDSPNGRARRNVHGILILFWVGGHIYQFDYTELMTVLSTALVSVAVASTLTDFLMMYAFADSKQFTTMKYQPSPDMYNQQKLERDTGEKDRFHRTLLQENAATMALPADKDLLHVLFKFEQRLNRLDGMSTEEGEIEDCIKKRENEHREEAKTKKNNKDGYAALNDP